jgi:hypothetical protein
MNIEKISAEIESMLQYDYYHAEIDNLSTEDGKRIIILKFKGKKFEIIINEF